MTTHRSRGFTLIELLVVIAIIGILSAVVLASLSSARSKGSDAAIQSDLSTVQTQAEIYYSNNGNAYSTVGLAATTCTNTANTLLADPTIWSAIQGAIAANGGTAATVSKCAVATAGDSYAVEIAAKSTTGWYCSDSSGNSNKFTAGATAPALGGLGSVAKCP